MMDYTCPWCGAEIYDNVIFLLDDPKDRPRCGDCLNDVRTEFIDQWVRKETCDDRVQKANAGIQ